MVVFLVLILVLAVKGLQSRGPGAQSSDSLDILKERFARGEIDDEEFYCKMQSLKKQ